MDNSTPHLLNLVIQQNGQHKMLKIRNPPGEELREDRVSEIIKDFMHHANSNSCEAFQTKYSNGTTRVVVEDASVSPPHATYNSHHNQSDSSGQYATTTTPPQPAPTQQQQVQPGTAAGTRSTSASMYAPSGSSSSNVSENSFQWPEAKSGNAGQQHQQQQPTTPQQLQQRSAPTPSPSKSAGRASASRLDGPSGSGSSSSSTPLTPKSRRKAERGGKGLRHFSMKVCEKVNEKGVTTYNEVADELVTEFCFNEAKQKDPAAYDQKNIRRRVYDALNVLMAMNIISKDKKEIRWIGLPNHSSQRCPKLERENAERRKRIEAKQAELRELLLQQVSFQSLVTRNTESEARGILPSPSSAIQMPFIIVNTDKKTHVNCSISADKSEYHFKFDNSFEIHDDIQILKRMGLLLGLDTGDCSPEDIERAKTMVPKAFGKYIEMYGRGETDSLDLSGAGNTSGADNLVPKTEAMTDDEEELDDGQYSDASDME